MNNIQNPVYIFTRRIVSPFQDLIIDYPFATGFKTLNIQNIINSRIIKTVNETGKLLEQGYKSPQMTVQGWYEIKTNEKGVLSLSIGNYTIAYPAAHGLTIIKSLTFDISTGKEYRLEELFKPGSDYVGTLSKIIERQIKEREIPILGEFKGIRPNQDYYIADKALVIYFQLYEITPYAFGFPMFPISVYEIQDIIREGSPLAAMLKKTEWDLFIPTPFFNSAFLPFGILPSLKLNTL